MRPSLNKLQNQPTTPQQIEEPFPCFLDFEASSLGHRSYPIEVAFSLQDGWVESHLIRPSRRAGWDEWSPQAEAVHGISQDLLKLGGHPPHWVATRLNDTLKDQIVYCDGGEYDQFWLSRLFQAAGMRPTFTLADCADLFERYLPAGTLDGLVRRAREAAYARHRAALDVGYLLALWRSILVESQRYTSSLSA